MNNKECTHPNYRLVDRKSTRDGVWELRECQCCFLRYKVLLVAGKEVIW